MSAFLRLSRNGEHRGLRLLPVVLLVLMAAPASAQLQSIDAVPAVPVEPEPPPQWTLHAAAEPEPALRYQFWPDRSETRRGNAMVPVQRALVLMLEKQRHEQLNKQFADSYNRWMEGPLDAFPRDESRAYLDRYGSTLSEVHRARGMEDVEYDVGISEAQGPAVYSILLPEFQNMRQLARLLALEIRLAVAEQRYDDAVRSLQTGFRLADVAGSASDLIIGRLVGLAIGGLMLEQVEEALQQPDAPNFYWALASLPDSLWDMQSAIQLEASLLQRVLPELSDLPAESLSDQAWRERLVQSIMHFSQLGGDIAEGSSDADRAAAARLYAGLAVITFADASRDYLKKRSGIDAEAVAAMSPSEAIVRAVQRQLASLRSDYFKWTLLPTSLRREYQDRSDKLLRDPRGQYQNPAAALYGLMMPAVSAANTAALRSPQRIAMLATVEALRMHAIDSGQFPETLKDLEPVPAWPDPVTGKLLEYQRLSPTEAKISREPLHSGDPNTTVILQLAPPKP